MTREQPIDRGAATPLPPARKRGDAPIAIALGILATLIGLIVLAWTILFVTKGRFLKPTFEKYASRFSERQIRVAGDFQLYFDPIDVHFVAEGLTVSNPSWAPKPNFFESKLIDTRIRTVPLIFGTKHVQSLVLDGAAIDAEWDGKTRNTWTFGDPNQKGAPFQMPLIERGVVTGTTVRYVDPAMQIAVHVKVNTVDARDTKVSDKQVGFTGTGFARGHPFQMNGALTTPNSTLTFGRTGIVVHATANDTIFDVSGTLPAATQIEGADLSVAARGHNLQNLFALAGIAVPDTRSYRLRSHLTKVGGEYRFTHLVGGYGDSDLEGSMTISLPNDRMKLVADLASRRVDMLDIGPFIGFNPDALAAKGPTAAVKQTGGAPRIIPDAPLRMDMIKNFDAHVAYRVTDFKQTYIPASNIALVLDLDHSLLKLSPLTMDVANSGHLASDISIDARVPQVVTDYDIRLSPTPLGKLFQKSGVFNAGTTGTIKAHIKMRGTGNTLRQSLATSNGRIAIILPAGTFWTEYAQLAEFDVGVFLQKLLQGQLKKPIEVNCGLVAFTVKDGVAATDPVLIDTDKNVMTMKGGFSFKDESMNLLFRADGKKFSAFSAQSPVGINGHFAAPGYQLVTPQLLTRAGAAVALGVVASPVAAVLAFVDPGDAKAAACGPVLSAAPASAQRTTKGQPRKDVGTATTNETKADKPEPAKKKKFLGIF